MKPLLILCALIFSTGCMSLLDSSDWARVNTKLESLGMDEEERAVQIAEWKAREAEQAAALVALGKGVKDMVIDIGGTLAGFPETVREGGKDWTDDIMKWLLLLGGGTAVLGGAEVGRRKLKNSQPGRVFGPVNGVKAHPPKTVPLDALATLNDYIEDALEDAMKKVPRPNAPPGPEVGV